MLLCVMEQMCEQLAQDSYIPSPQQQQEPSFVRKLPEVSLSAIYMTFLASIYQIYEGPAVCQ